MISKRMENLFLISIALFILHGLEEYFTGFYDVDNFFQIVFKSLIGMEISQSLFLLFQIAFWSILIISYFLIFKRDCILSLLTVLGAIIIFEIHHLIKMVAMWAYYPGSVMALFFPILGYFYWKELVKLHKTK